MKMKKNIEFNKNLSVPKITHELLDTIYITNFTRLNAIAGLNGNSIGAKENMNL